MADIPDGYEPAKFSPGFLHTAGPFYLKGSGARALVGLRIAAHHINYVEVAHGGVLATLADVALSWQVHIAETPRRAVVTNAMTTNFLGPAKLGDWLEAEARVDRLGRRLAHASGSIRRDGETIMTMSANYTVLRSKSDS